MYAILLAAILTTVHGRVVLDGSPLPGVEVSVGSAKAITDGEGFYKIAVSPGAYDIAFHLSGLTDTQQRIVVRPGDNNAGDQAMRLIVLGEDLVIAEPPCIQVPTSVWDWPACSDYDFDTALETGAKRGDHSAIDLLEQRYEAAFTFREKRQIAGILLNRLPDDSKYWKALIPLAEDALRFAGEDDAAQARLQAFATEKGIDPEAYLEATYDAFGIVSGDVRSRPLLRRAIESEVPDLQVFAVIGFAEQHDESVLDLIDSAIEKATRFQDNMAQCLVEYRSEAADKIAFKYLSESDRADYLEAKGKLSDLATTSIEGR